MFISVLFRIGDCCRKLVGNAGSAGLQCAERALLMYRLFSCAIRNTLIVFPNVTKFDYLMLLYFLLIRKYIIHFYPYRLNFSKVVRNVFADCCMVQWHNGGRLAG